MTPDPQFPDTEPRLRAWLADRAPADVPSELAERVRAIPHRSVDGGGPSGARPGRRVPPVLLAATVAAVTVALLAGTILLGSRREARVNVPSAAPTIAPASPAASTRPASPSIRPSARPAPSPTPLPVEAGVGLWPSDFRSADGILPAVVPSGVEYGTMETPVGRARWVHLQGDRASLPDPLVPDRQPGGPFVWFVPGVPGSACDDPASTGCTDARLPSLAVSTDLLADREVRPLPEGGTVGALSFAGGRWWYLGSAPAAVSWSDDLETWHTVDLRGFVPAGPSSLEYETRAFSILTLGEVAVVTIESSPEDPGRLVGLPGVQLHLHADPHGGYRVMEQRSLGLGGEIDRGHVDVQETDDGIAFVDAEGRTVGVVPGAPPDFASDWVRDGSIRYLQLLAIDGEDWVAGDLPGADIATETTLQVLDGRLWAFGVDAAQTVHGWRSSDGVNWSADQTFTTADGRQLMAPGGIVATPDGRVAAIDADGTSAWVTTDGHRWAKGAESSLWASEPHVSQGWIRTADQSEDGTWQISPDRETWVEIPALKAVIRKTAPDGAGGSSETAIGDTLFFSVVEDDDPGERDLWVIEFEAPAS